MKKSAEFVQAEGNEADPHTEIGVSLREKKDRILKRAVLEVLPYLHLWAEKKSPLTQLTIRETLKKPSLYHNAPPSQWRGVLEEFAEREIEILCLEKPLLTKDILQIGIRKTALTERLEEIREIQEEILLLLWHQENGLLACSSGTLPHQHPKIHTAITFQTPQNTSHRLWLWDRKNFSPNE